MSVSGVNQNDYLEQLLYLESQPLRNLQAKRGTLDVRLGILSDLRSKVSAFKSLISGFAELGSGSVLRQFNVASSDDTVATATASATANTGSHTLTVDSLAQAHKIASSGFVGTGSDITANSYTFEITVDGTATSISVDIAADDDNATAMQKVVDVIRSSGAPVTADLVTVDPNTDTRKIVLSATESGTANLIASVTDTSGNLMADLGLAGTSAVGSFSANTTVEALDANFTLDGLTLTSADNEVEDVLTGIVINLRDTTSENEVITLTIGFNEEDVHEKVDEMVSSFNEIMSYLNSKLGSGDETGSGRGDLAGDLTFMMFRNELKQSLVRSVSGVTGDINSIDDVGLSIARDGTLSVSDSDEFFAQLTANPDDVEAFFASEDGIASRLKEMANAFTKIGGSLQLSTELVDSKKDMLDLRIERMEEYLALREEQIRSELGRLSQLVAQIGFQQQALGSLNSTGSCYGFY